MARQPPSPPTSPGAPSCRPNIAPAARKTGGSTTCPSRLSAATATATAGCLRSAKSCNSENDVGAEHERERGLGERREVAGVLAAALVDHAEVELQGVLLRL